MAQIGELKVYTATGVQSLPIFELADFGANVYKVFKVYTPSGVGAIPLIDPGAGTADRPWFKVYSDVSGGLVLEGHSSASLAPAYTLITDFSSFSTANYDVNYSATIKADEGDVISLDVYFNSLPGSGTFNQCILYFGCDSQSNTLRLQVDPKNNTCVLAKASGGAPSTIDSSTFSSAPSGWWEVKIDWKDSTTDIICDVIDKGTGLSILTSQPTGTDGGSHSAKTGIGFYAKSNTGLFFNTYRRVT